MTNEKYPLTGLPHNKTSIETHLIHYRRQNPLRIPYFTHALPHKQMAELVQESAAHNKRIHWISS